MINFFIWLLTSIPALLMYFPLHIPESYENQMRNLGVGLRLPWKDDETGELSMKEINMCEMSWKELRDLEQECRNAGLREANSVHAYREFKIRGKLSLREDRKRIRDRMMDSLRVIGIDPGTLTLSKLDEMAQKLGMTPRAEIFTG